MTIAAMYEFQDDMLVRAAERFVARAAARDLKIAVIGMGYVGLPLSEALVEAGFDMVGYDVDPGRVEALNAGASYVSHFTNARVQRMLASGRFVAANRAEAIESADAYLICVPTPIDEHRTPDLSFVERAGELIAGVLRPGALVVLESTTYPGTTQDILRPILERHGLEASRDFALAYSPERIDPGNADHTAASTPKVCGADTSAERAMVAAVYGAFTEIVPVCDCKTAEAVKLTENIFRLVNISLANELKHAFAKLDIDLWEVIEAASTKPFGYMPFYPGPGVGGHCIPVDPFYLAWKVREAGDPLRLVEVAGDIAHEQPVMVVDGVARALNDRFGKALRGARVLVLGVAYKRDIGDVRETPAGPIIDELYDRGVSVSYSDPHVPGFERPCGMLKSVGLRNLEFSDFDCVLIVTDHTGVDYEAVAAKAHLIIDTRNATANLSSRYRRKLIKL